MYQHFEETASFFISNTFIRNTKIGKKIEGNYPLPSSMLPSKNRVYPIEMLPSKNRVYPIEMLSSKNRVYPIEMLSSKNRIYPVEMCKKTKCLF